MQPTLRSYPSRSRSEGFSLVELVVVITLLGILCSFAIPRFTRLENDARASEVVALSLNLRSASAAAHAQYGGQFQPHIGNFFKDWGAGRRPMRGDLPGLAGGTQRGCDNRPFHRGLRTPRGP